MYMVHLHKPLFANQLQSSNTAFMKRIFHYSHKIQGIIHETGQSRS